MHIIHSRRRTNYASYHERTARVSGPHLMYSVLLLDSSRCICESLTFEFFFYHSDNSYRYYFIIKRIKGGRYRSGFDQRSYSTSSPRLIVGLTPVPDSPCVQPDHPRQLALAIRPHKTGDSLKSNYRSQRPCV